MNLKNEWPEAPYQISEDYKNTTFFFSLFHNFQVTADLDNSPLLDFSQKAVTHTLTQKRIFKNQISNDKSANIQPSVEKW